MHNNEFRSLFHVGTFRKDELVQQSWRRDRAYHPVMIKRIPIPCATSKWKGAQLPKEAAFMAKAKDVPGCANLEAVANDDRCYMVALTRPTFCSFLNEMLESSCCGEANAKTIFEHLVRACIGCRDRGFYHDAVHESNVLVNIITDAAQLVNFESAVEIDEQNGQELERRCVDSLKALHLRMTGKECVVGKDATLDDLL